MKNWKALWQRYAGRIDAMSLRERAMIFLAAALIMVVLINLTLIEPLSERHKQLKQTIIQTQQKTGEMQRQIQSLAKNWRADPDVQLRARLEQLRAQSDRTGKMLTDMQSGLVPPERIHALLEDILQRNRSLHLVGLKNIPVTGLGEAAENKTGLQSAVAEQPAGAPNATPPEVVIYQHGVEITVEGSYLDLLRYLTEIEALPWRMFWGKADLEVVTYPRATLTLRLYTLSLDKTWLAI